MARIRLDSLLVERGVFATRSRAAAAVMAGNVHVGDRSAVVKPGRLVEPDVPVQVDATTPYVSRGGIKLQNALAAFDLDPRGRACLDVGASTGGFADCLLQHGATRVIALDVAYGQLDWGLRNDPRVTVVERLNARSLAPQTLPYRPDLVVIDVSFVSLTKVLPSVLACTAEPFDCLALVKPQFEVGRSRLPRGGVVRSADDRRSALVDVGRFALDAGWSLIGYASSGLPGPAGNRESFVWIAEAGRTVAGRHGGGLAGASVDEAARRVEP